MGGPRWVAVSSVRIVGPSPHAGAGAFGTRWSGRGRPRGDCQRERRAAAPFSLRHPLDLAGQAFPPHPRPARRNVLMCRSSWPAPTTRAPFCKAHSCPPLLTGTGAGLGQPVLGGRHDRPLPDSLSSREARVGDGPSRPAPPPGRWAPLLVTSALDWERAPCWCGALARPSCASPPAARSDALTLDGAFGQHLRRRPHRQGEWPARGQRPYLNRFTSARTVFTSYSKGAPLSRQSLLSSSSRMRPGPLSEQIAEVLSGRGQGGGTAAGRRGSPAGLNRLFRRGYWASRRDGFVPASRAYRSRQKREKDGRGHLGRGTGAAAWPVS
jgi:hypothetical protein